MFHSVKEKSEKVFIGLSHEKAKETLAHQKFHCQSDRPISHKTSPMKEKKIHMRGN